MSGAGTRQGGVRSRDRDGKYRQAVSGRSGEQTGAGSLLPRPALAGRGLG
jgi:hypothetical protein